MKKVLIAASLFAGILFAACNKTENVTGNSTGKQFPPLSKISLLIPGTDSGIHNELTRNVMINHTEQPEGVREMAGWYVDAFNVLYGTSINVDSLSGFMVSSAMASGMLDSASCLSSGNMLIHTTLANAMPNSSLKTAIQDINNNTDTGITFLNYAKGKIAGISGLTVAENNMIDGYIGILEGSYNMGKNTMGSRAAEARISKADAEGFVYGFIIGGPTFADINAAWDSAIQRDIENGVCPICHQKH